jgi:hypothetical protein
MGQGDRHRSDHVGGRNDAQGDGQRTD